MKDWAGVPVDPLVVRGEVLLDLQRAGRASPAEEDELRSLQAAVAAKQKHLAAYPLAASSIEESVQDLADEEARSAREREAALHEAWQIFKPIAFEAFKAGAAAVLKR